MDSFNIVKHKNYSNSIFKWFVSSKYAEQKYISLTLKTINLPVSVRQSDGHSCANFVCVYSYVAIILSIKYSTKDDWLVSFNDMVIKHVNADRTIMDLKKNLECFVYYQKRKIM